MVLPANACKMLLASPLLRWTDLQLFPESSLILIKCIAMTPLVPIVNSLLTKQGEEKSKKWLISWINF